MQVAEPAEARFRDLVIAVLPVFLLTSAAVSVFLVRQIWGPSRSIEIAVVVVAVLPLVGAVYTGWSPWRAKLRDVGHSRGGAAVRVAVSAVAFAVIATLAWGAPWFVIRRVVDLASPFESMRWILTLGIILHGLAFRWVLSSRRVPVWMGVAYWIACAAIGTGMWNQVAGLFS